MKIRCIKCCDNFTIKAEQLGKRGKCPHCKATIVLPKSESQTGYSVEQLEPPKRFLENLLSGFGAVILHLLALIILALIPYGDFSDGEGGEGDQIMIGQLSREQLVNNPVDELKQVEIENQAEDQPRDILDNELFSPSTESPLAENEFELTLPSMASGQKAFEIQSENQSTVLAGGAEDFGKMISRLKRDGLDIVITFDSTGSMQAEIDEVKNKIERLGTTLFKMVPKTRISICTYRDHKDLYLVKGQPLTTNLAQIVEFLEGVEAGGGGDVPEAVHLGLEWSIKKNRFRNQARKVILLFGDAPPHPDKVITCEKLASDFRKRGGIVSTVTCHSEFLLPEFESISKIGAGEAFLTENERGIMTQLMVLVFGGKHRGKVVQAFDLLDD